MNGALAVEKPELRCELHAAARPTLCLPRTKLSNLPGQEPGPMLGRPGTPGDSPQQLPLVLALPGRHLLKDAPHAALVSLQETRTGGRSGPQLSPFPGRGGSPCPELAPTRGAERPQGPRLGDHPTAGRGLSPSASPTVRPLGSWAQATLNRRPRQPLCLLFWFVFAERGGKD